MDIIKKIFTFSLIINHYALIPSSMPTKFKTTITAASSKQNNLDELNNLIKSTNAINSTPETLQQKDLGQTQLHLAILNLDFCNVCNLIAKGDCVNAHDNAGQSPLDYAVMKYPYNKISNFINQNIKEDTTSNIFWKKFVSNLSIIKMLYESNAQLSSYNPTNGELLRLWNIIIFKASYTKYTNVATSQQMLSMLVENEYHENQMILPREDDPTYTEKVLSKSDIISSNIAKIHKYIHITNEEQCLHDSKLIQLLYDYYQSNKIIIDTYRHLHEMELHNNSVVAPHFDTTKK